MVKRQRNGTWVLFVIFGLAAVVALLIFSGKSGMTGNVVLGGYTDQAACEAANYIWEVLTQENCTPIDGCVLCVEGCPETCETCEDVVTGQACSNVNYITQADCELAEETWADVIEEQCTDIPDCVACVGGCPETCETCEDVVIGGQCVGDICDNSHLTLCDVTTCTAEIGYWYNDVCNAEAQPIACTPEWNPTDWSECSNGVRTRTMIDEQECDITYTGSQSLSEPCSEDSTTTTTTTTTPTTGNDVAIVTYSVCSPSQESCANGALYTCNTEGTGWDLKQDCELGCAGNACAVLAVETVAETCEDGVKNQDEAGVDCGGVCSNRCSIFTLAGSVVSGPVESGKQFIANVTSFFTSNKTRMYLILGGVGVLVAGFVAFMVFKKKIISLVKKK